MQYNLIYLLLFTFVFTACKKDSKQFRETSLEQRGINEFQIIGSHNSYRIITYEPLFDFVLGISHLLPSDLNPNQWDYDHLPLTEQLDNYQIRNFELDIYNDPDGGHFYNRMGLSFIDEPVESGIPELLEPGFKVMHIPDFDYETHHYTLVDAFQTIKNWSDANPGHFPLIIMIEAKSSGVAESSPIPIGNLKEVIPYTEQSAEDIDNEVKAIFGEELTNIITPDKVRGVFTSLNAAITENGWPSLADARGKILFVIQGNQLISHYKAGRPNLEGRAMFTFAEPGEDHAAFVIRNNPKSSFSEIQDLVRSGYIVRTRADANTTEARIGDTSKKQAAFNSGAQIISTDYYKSDYRAETSQEWTNYSVQFEGNNVARWIPFISGDTESDIIYLER